MFLLKFVSSHSFQPVSYCSNDWLDNVSILGKSSQTPEAWAWTDAVEMIVGKAARPYIKYEHEKISDGYDR